MFRRRSLESHRLRFIVIRETPGSAGGLPEFDSSGSGSISGRAAARWLRRMPVRHPDPAGGGLVAPLAAAARRKVAGVSATGPTLRVNARRPAREAGGPNGAGVVQWVGTVRTAE